MNRGRKPAMKRKNDSRGRQTAARLKMTAVLLAAAFALGACSFGLYLLQHYFLAWLRPVYTALSPVIGSYPACLVWVLCICLAGSGVTLLLRQIPGLNKLI